jgi:hypothetical protein
MYKVLMLLEAPLLETLLAIRVGIDKADVVPNVLNKETAIIIKADARYSKVKESLGR